MRRRTNEEKAPPHESTLIDADEQEEVVTSLEKEGTEQIERMNRIFTAICIMAIAMTLVVVALDGGVAHGIYSVCVHWLARTHATTDPCAAAPTSVQFNTFTLLILLVLSPLLLLVSSLASMNADDKILHWSIALANLLVALCAFFLRMESANTFRALGALEQSKYDYKSL